MVERQDERESREIEISNAGCTEHNMSFSCSIAINILVKYLNLSEQNIVPCKKAVRVHCSLSAYVNPIFLSKVSAAGLCHSEILKPLL